MAQTKPPSSPESQASPVYMSLKTRLHTPLAEPEIVLWLRDLTLTMSTTQKPNEIVRFELLVRRKHPNSHLSIEATAWVQSRPLSDFITLRDNLLRDLEPGHSCSAECKWLYTVVKQHFPKPQTMLSPCALKTERRRVALLRVLTTIQSTLVTHGNRGCRVLMGDVLKTFSTFLVGDRTSLSRTALALPVPYRQGLINLPNSLGKRLASLRTLSRVRR
ncbi:uncharacterized protein PHALS_01311 [Plasmopara halstedii]|uniref:Phox homologous domain n=1 Tax=Plasmopara halstedii TaxID=4781 RepID=A0A0P1AUB4_PLAHL|nr:uncharacterized protein PHALS_01311 [Plasmopara halstedii]CEG44988.1 hypothetical protein PHALS_01311 [Plasmopara halstedii]|eukprot:XP_024581357.1 hypothetical protein PHALS_01311 [Plasmopara halstedii]